MESYLSMIFFGGGEDKARKREAEGLTRPSEPNSRCRSSSEAWAFCVPVFFWQKENRADGRN